MSELWKLISAFAVKYWLHLVLLIAGFLLGWLFAQIKQKEFIQKQKRRLENLENWIMLVSFIIALICMFSGITGVSTQMDSQYLSIYSSFIFAWILTKKTAGKDFRKNQHKIAKSTYRHIQDAETAVLIAKNRLTERRGTQLNEGDVDGLIDDLQIILTCIRSNKKDWRDMLKKKYQEKIDNEEDPEDILQRDYYKGTNEKTRDELKEKMQSTFEEELKEAKKT
ncbi:MAG: hypothetical protein NC123_16960 [Butyrivibrio sp.]|nr:hypothetical protein [Acetatifactor muris]MCM1561209.1 hypothetical protein [Butyrivibrio sp.]